MSNYKKIAIILLLSCFKVFSLAFIPEGFGDLSTEEEGDVKVYYGRQYLGVTLAKFDDHFIRFLNLKFFDDKLDAVRDVQFVKKQLDKDLDPHADKVCHNIDKAKCPFLAPKTVGVIFDRDNYKVYLYINSNMLKPAQKEKIKYKELTKTPFAYLNRFKIGSSGNINNSSIFVTSQSILSKNNKRLTALSSFNTYIHKDGNPDDENQFRVYHLDYQFNKKNTLYHFGLVDTDSLTLLPEMNVMGANVETNYDLVTNKHVNYGTPIEVNLTSPSLITVTKNSLIIYSNYLNAGNHFLNTKDFPEGSYPIQINIKPAVGEPVELDRFFVKQSSMPAKGSPEYSVATGLIMSDFADSRAVFPTIEKQYVFQGVYRRRLAKKTAGDIGFLSDVKYTIISPQIDWFSSNKTLSLSGAVASDRDIGLAASYSVNFSGISLSLFSRHMFAKKMTMLSSGAINPIDKLMSLQSDDGIALSTDWRGFQLTGAFDRTLDNDNRFVNSFGLSAKKTLYNKGHLKIDWSADISNPSDSMLYLMTLNFTFTKRKFDNLLTYQYQRTQPTNKAPAEIEHTSEYHLQYTKSDKTKFSGGIDSNKDGNQYDAGFTTKIKGVDISGEASYMQNYGNKNDYLYSIQFNHNANMGYVWSGKHFAWSSDMPTTTGVLIHVNSPDPKAKFQIEQVDGDISANVTSGGSVFLPLQAYKVQHIAVTAKGSALEIVKQPTPVMLAPGMVYPFNIEAKMFFNLMGNFYYPNGEPVSESVVEGGVIIAETDEEGFGAVDVYNGAKLLLTPIDEGSAPACMVDTSQLEPEDGLYYGDEIICKPLKPNEKESVLDDK